MKTSSFVGEIDPHLIATDAHEHPIDRGERDTKPGPVDMWNLVRPARL